jgi:hypothetical protein
MRQADDPMRSQHLTLGAEAFPDWRDIAGSQPRATTAASATARPAKHHAGRLAAGITGSTLLSLALMFSGNASSDVEPAADRTADTSGFAEAMRDYEDCRWQEAFTRFAELAHRGHGEAARMAWQMWRYGPELFGMDFRVDAALRQRWMATWYRRPTPAKTEFVRP